MRAVPSRLRPGSGAATALLLLAATLAAAQPASHDESALLATSQAALGRQVGDYGFTAPDGRHVTLSDLRGRPVVVSLVYTSCYHTCPLLTQNLAQVVRVARAALGPGSFTVATIGFDTERDTPERMRLFAADRAAGMPEWQFLSADAGTIRGLTRDVGFSYTPAAGGFDHLAQVTVLDAEGRVYRQVYGERFTAPALVEPLKELVWGTPRGAGVGAALLNGVRLICTVYDPATGRYRFDYSVFVEIFVGAMCLGAVAWFVARSWPRT